ncbi:ROK family protein [Planomicrobium sp. Y74]|uniref:ROK family protein n=1 Tax=Planomicrobium sp. Y74 TaxID=2478977 RepID=UPI000EF45F78|nr:ROK family protein [Planomicrobium sp. Y74]RLQ92773.1 ROK family protein [Planomicrobium sp. Y74]
MEKVLGVDIGGTKIRLGIIDNAGNILFEKTVPTQVPLYSYLENLVQRVLGDFPEVTAIGIGTHGFVEPEAGRIIYATDILPGWTGTEVKEQLQKATGRRVEVENDANCAALAEVKFGAAKGIDRVVCLTLGTGLGGGIVWDGKLLSGGTHGGAAEIGHMVLYPKGVHCVCGRKGCLEQYISGTALRRRIEEAGLTIEPEELFKEALFSDSAKRVVDSFIEDLAVAVSSLQAIFDMEMLVIGGGVSESAELWWKQFEQHLEPILLNPLAVKTAKFENDAGILGAALLVLD